RPPISLQRSHARQCAPALLPRTSAVTQTRKDPLMRHLPQNVLALAILLALPLRAASTVHYVDVNSTNATPPYTNWATAATNIQDAVDAALAGDEIMVTNGIYAGGGVGDNRVSISKPLTIQSVNGSGLTVIDGGGVVRCVWLTTNASLSGLTLTG